MEKASHNEADKRTRIVFAALLAAVVATEVLAAAPAGKAVVSQAPIPATWADFGKSSYPEDKKLFAEIPRMKWWDACIAWGRESRSGKNQRREEALQAFLTSERMLNTSDRSHVLDRSVDVGMTECGVFAALGLPAAANHTTTARGTSSQLVFRGRRMYVYTEERPQYSVKIVRAIQH